MNLTIDDHAAETLRDQLAKMIDKANRAGDAYLAEIAGGLYAQIAAGGAPSSAYAVHYVDNLRTGATSMHGIVDADAALGMLSRSTEPRRLRFDRIDAPREVCRYCGAFADIIGEFEPADFHASAECVAAVEPVK